MGKDIETFISTWFRDNAAVIDEIVALQGEDAGTPYGSAVAAYMNATPKWTPAIAERLVFELPFSELLATSSKPLWGRDSPARARMRQTMANTQRLQSEVTAAVVRVQSTLAETFALLAQD